MAKAMMQEQMNLMMNSMHQMESVVTDALSQMDNRLADLATRVAALQPKQNET
jgi:uncharacterized coiled-coil protein SlyX